MVSAKFLWENQFIGEEVLTPIEINDAQKWELIRGYRNELLSKCDWTQLIDSPLTESQKQDWQTYRQELRDITETYSSPDDVVFAEIPS